MFNFIKNKFAFIIIISVLTLGLLIAGAIVMYQDNSKVFESEGYIISTTTKKNSKYYFSPNTKYKENVDKDITFKDSDSKSVTVSSENFVHYQNGSISFLTRGALLNLGEINSSALNYYNVDNDDIITYKNKNYVVNSNKGTVNIESFIGRISDNKYIIAGNNLSLKIPNKTEKITGDYFEVLFIENGIVKIDNKESSYQVTAQDTTISVGNDTVIDLGTGKIFHNGEAKMLMSQLTINGDENIDIETPEKKDNDSSGSGGDGDGGNDGNEIINPNNNSDSNNNSGNDNNQNGGGQGEDNNSNGGNGGNGKADSAAQIELIEANVTSTDIDLSFQLNNASAIKGKLVATLTNVNNNKRELEKEIDARNGTFTVSKESLLPDSEYTLTITETNVGSEKQYFQKTFKTNDLGIVLEKEYATSSSLAYSIKFNENSEVTKAKLVLYNSGGIKEGNEDVIISADDISKTREFNNLLSNSNYSAKVESIWIRNVEYTDVYTINRIDTTLKQTPILSDIQVTPNAEEIKFTIRVNNIEDPDKGIISFKYNIYKAEDITIDNPEPEPVYTINKNDRDDLILNLNEIEELRTGVDYRCKVVALYNDNVMIREASSDYSSNFLIKSKPSITWTTTSTSINKVVGTLKLTDGNCSIPIPGRRCNNKQNNFTVRYYKLGEDESEAREKEISFNPENLTSNVSLEGLSSNTTYTVKLYGNYIDDDNNEHKNVQIGDIIYVKTDVSENLKFKIIKDNESGKEEGNDNIRTAPVVTFDAKLEAPKDSTISEEISSITFNLYSGSYNVENKLIGTYKMENRNDIQDFFNNFTITNKLFSNEATGLINTVDKLVTLTNNQTGTLNSTYTVEVVDVMDSAGVNEIFVEDNIYTFKLTPSYYLDVRINTNTTSKYITVTPIKKKSLTEEEYNELKGKDNDLELLNDDTIVGIIIENNLTDTYVDSAFKYEKVIVDYIIYNNTTNKENKRISIDMGNKYQPKSQTVYLDPTELDDGENYFTRGYNYTISYELKFTTEKGDNPVYRNDKLSEKITIKKQSAIYSQYISTSTADSITYRLKITDIDKSLYDKKIYYAYKEQEKNHTEEDITIDGEFHDVTLPISERKEYSIFFREKSVDNRESYKEISKYNFEKEYEYDNQNAYQIVNDNDNTLKIKILDNDITNRAAVYKLTIKENSGSLEDYSKLFLASNLVTENIETGELDDEGNPIKKEVKYISLDYAKIHEYMKHDLTISVESYFNSGLVGFNQRFPNGMVLYNGSKYLNIYNAPGTNAISKEEEKLNGIYKLKNEFEKDSDKLSLYNYLKGTNNYDKLGGADIYDIDQSMGLTFQVTYNNSGVVLRNDNKDYMLYNSNVVKTATLKANDYSYRFNSITPKVSIVSNNTINSLKIKVNSTGVYGQFIKSGQEHNVFYIDVYSDKELTNENHLSTLTSNITITNNTAESEQVELKNLKPNTTYYVTVSAYVDGVLTKLYDMDSKNGYIVKTYESKTLGPSEIISSYDFKVKPIAYDGEASKKELSWTLRFANKNGNPIKESQENLKIRFELYDQEDNPIKFDGTAGTSCNKNVEGIENESYVKNCYIQIPKEKLEDIHAQTIKYYFSNNNFIFGEGAYKLIIYAVPYTNGTYKEEDKIIISQIDNLSTQNASSDPITRVKYTTEVNELKSPSVSIKDLESGTRCITVKDEEGNTLYDDGSPRAPVCDSSANQNSVEYYIEFKPVIIDNSYAIKYGTYTIKLKNSKNEVVNTRSNVSASTENKTITFTGLDANALYYVELSYETYRNNVGYSESEKVATTPFTDFIYTPIDVGITLGTITATQNNNKRLTLTYNGAYNMTNNIKKVKYTISLKSGSSNATGSFEIAGDITNIFTISSDKTPKLSIDLSESSDESFTLKAGNTYFIMTEYWYMMYKDDIYDKQKNPRAGEQREYLTIGENKQCRVNPDIVVYNREIEKCYWPLTDQNTGNDKFTTILNL
ncbi:MAG: hypothetical protein IJI49_02790 [Bacilli bacterium]|nr:hypothetical protein [Bacilli bacterium]